MAVGMHQIGRAGNAEGRQDCIPRFCGGGCNGRKRDRSSRGRKTHTALGGTHTRSAASGEGE